MTKRLWKWDEVARELVTADELERRRIERAPKVRATLFLRPVERGRWIWDREAQEVVTAAEYARRRAVRGNSARSDLPCPAVHSDIEFQNVAVDGQWIGSRSEQREMMKRYGLVEVGNDFQTPPPPPEMPPVGQTIKDSIERLEAGYKPAPVETLTDNWASS